MVNRSCVTQLVEVFDLNGSKLGREGQVDIIYLDIFKAFDQVSHRKILSVLQKEGFGDNLLAWFNSYLQKRFQRVIALSVSSRSLPMTLGIPQGKVLSHMLFLLRTNLSPELVTSSPVVSFADDTKIVKTTITY